MVPDNLPRLAFKRKVEFTINLVTGTVHISKALYKIASTELQELKKQLR